MGPAILVANHNSHLDTLALFALFSLRETATLHAMAAHDYFSAGSVIGWLAHRVFGAVAANRAWRPDAGDPLAGCSRVLRAGGILILFPEGTRGTPGVLGELKA